MWVWDERLQDWVWVRKPGSFGPLQAILLILAFIFLFSVLFPGKLEEWVKNRNLLPPIPPQVTTQPMFAPTQVIPQILPQEPVYLVVTATPRPGWDVPITPDANPAWVGPLPTQRPQPSILEWQPGMPLPEPMGPPLPPVGNPYP